MVKERQKESATIIGIICAFCIFQRATRAGQLDGRRKWERDHPLDTGQREGTRKKRKEQKKTTERVEIFVLWDLFTSPSIFFLVCLFRFDTRRCLAKTAERAKRTPTQKIGRRRETKLKGTQHCRGRAIGRTGASFSLHTLRHRKQMITVDGSLMVMPLSLPLSDRVIDSEQNHKNSTEISKSNQKRLSTGPK